MTWGPYTRIVCDGCGAEFLMREAKASPFGDAACPECGGVRLDRVITGFQRLFQFLVTYEQY